MQLMIVDDESILLKSLQYLLASVGIESKAFLDPVDALQEIELRPHAFDGVVTDLAMPRMRGSRLAREIWARRPDMPVTILSGLADENRSRDEMGSRRGLVVLPKPAELTAVLEALRRQGLHVPEYELEKILAA